jgi:hypothetical protein
VLWRRLSRSISWWAFSAALLSIVNVMRGRSDIKGEPSRLEVVQATMRFLSVLAATKTSVLVVMPRNTTV